MLPLLTAALMASSSLIPTTSATTSSTALVVDEGLAAQAQQYRALREVHGHFSTPQGEWNADVDSFGGAKYTLMQTLREALTGATTTNSEQQEPGSDATTTSTTKPTAAEVVGLLGEPDVLLDNIGSHSIADNDNNGSDGNVVPLMPGPVVSTNSHAQYVGKPYYLVYKWRGMHDYMWFRVDTTTSGDEIVTKSGWYMAGE